MSGTKTKAEFWKELHRISDRIDGCDVNFNVIQEETKGFIDFAKELADVANTVREHVEKLMSEHKTNVEMVNLLKTSAEQHFQAPELEKLKNTETQAADFPVINLKDSESAEQRKSSERDASPEEPKVSEASKQEDKENRPPTMNYANSLKKNMSKTTNRSTQQEISNEILKSEEPIPTTGNEWIKPKKVFPKKEIRSIQKSNQLRTDKNVPQKTENVVLKKEQQDQEPPQVVPQVAPQVAPQVVPQVVPQVALQVALQVAPQVAPQIVPQVASQIVPQVASPIVSQVAPQIVPQVASQIVPQVALQIVPKVASQVVPQNAPKIVPQIAPQIVPQVATQDAPQVALQVAEIVREEELALEVVPDNTEGLKSSTISERKKAAQIKKELKEQQEREKRERRQQKKEKRLDEEKKKQTELAETRKNIQIVVINTIEYMKRTEHPKFVKDFNIETAKRFIEDRLHYYKRINDVEFTEFYTVLEENMCNAVLSILQKAYQQRKSAIECGNMERAYLQDMKLHSKTRGTWLEARLATQFIDSLLSFYVSIQEEIRYENAPISEALQAEENFMELNSLWKSSDKEQFNFEVSNKCYMDLSAHHEALQSSENLFPAILYRKLADTKHQVLVDDGCMLAGMVSKGKTQSEVTEFYYHIMKVFNQRLIDDEKSESE